jgi:uncharacterized membrane protein (UPF0136 family)
METTVSTKTKKTTWVVFAYAICILMGGIMGHRFSSSKASLISGLVFGSLLLAASGLMFQRKSAGNWMALILAITLEGFFTWRFAKTLNFLPSGLLSLISLFVIILMALKVGKRLRFSR